MNQLAIPRSRIDFDRLWNPQVLSIYLTDLYQQVIIPIFGNQSIGRNLRVGSRAAPPLAPSIFSNRQPAADRKRDISKTDFKKSILIPQRLGQNSDRQCRTVSLRSPDRARKEGTTEPERLLSASSSPRKALRGGISKVNFQETLSIVGDKCPQNGSRNDPMAPRTTLECPHEGPSVVGQEGPAVGCRGGCSRNTLST